MISFCNSFFLCWEEKIPFSFTSLTKQDLILVIIPYILKCSISWFNLLLAMAKSLPLTAILGAKEWTFVIQWLNRSSLFVVVKSLMRNVSYVFINEIIEELA